MLRHLAICAAAAAAYAMRDELRTNGRVLGVLGSAALGNLAAALLSDVPAFRRAARWISPVIGVASWAALVFLTGGTGSPMVVGFGLEIVFSAIVFAPLGTILVTAAVAAALWFVEVLRDAGAIPLGRLSLQTGFVAAIGLLTFYASRRWRHEHQTLTSEASALSGRLRDLETELEAARALGQVGERVARLAHSLKNTVHSLRGFTELIETPSAGHIQRQALDGLRLAIDQLEETARATLRASAPAPDAEAAGATSALELGRTMDEVIAEMTRAHAGMRFVSPAVDRLPSVALPSSLLREVLLILAQNAADASPPSGEVELCADLEGGRLRLSVRDHGPGIDAATRRALFRPGVTTKARGSGFGLFLARRLVQSRGGDLTVSDGPGGGALVAVTLPISGG